MASLEELVELNNQGDLGRMLVERFHGELGHVYQRKDSEFMIGFESKEKTPTAQMIAEAVTEHYTKLGYGVEPSEHQSPNTFECLIFFCTRDEGVIHMTISTFYHLTVGDEHKHIRVTTTII